MRATLHSRTKSVPSMETLQSMKSMCCIDYIRIWCLHEYNMSKLTLFHKSISLDNMACLVQPNPRHYTIQHGKNHPCWQGVSPINLLNSVNCMVVKWWSIESKHIRKYLMLRKGSPINYYFTKFKTSMFETIFLFWYLYTMTIQWKGSHCQ